MKFNGWQHIGAVAAIFWAFFAYGWNWIETHEGARGLYRLSLSLCRSKEGPAYAQCRDLAAEEFDANFQDATRRFWLTVPFVIAAPPIAVWLLISLCIFVVRRVRRGLAERQEMG